MARPPADQGDLFLISLSGGPWRDQLDLMAVPVVNLSKSKRAGPILHRLKGGDTVEVSAPPHIGLASIWDWDIILWAVSQVNAAIDDGRPSSATLAVVSYDLLTAIHRGTGGRDYLLLREALDRLKATTVRTTMHANGRPGGATFGLLDSWSWREDEKGRMVKISMTLPRWIMDRIADHRVLAVDPRYFEISGGIARWLYRTARKQAGNNPAGKRWSLAELHAQSGNAGSLKEFTRIVRGVVRADNLPEYHLLFYPDASGGEALHAVRRSWLALDHPGHEPRIRRNPRYPA